MHRLGRPSLKRGGSKRQVRQIPTPCSALNNNTIFEMQERRFPHVGNFPNKNPFTLPGQFYGGAGPPDEISQAMKMTG